MTTLFRPPPNGELFAMRAKSFNLLKAFSMSHRALYTRLLMLNGLFSAARARK